MQENYRIFTAEELTVEYQTTQDEAILQELIIRNKGLIHIWVMNYHSIPLMDAEDLQSEAYIALWKAAKTFDPDKGYAFTSYLKGCVTQRFNRLYNEATRKKRFNGTEPTSYEELVEISREKATLDDHSGIYLSEFLESLSGTVKAVAQMLIEGCTNGEIARALSIAPASVTYHCKRLQKAYTLYMEG